MLQTFADFITYEIFKLAEGSHSAASLNFFIYDTVKILLLIFAVIFVISLVRTFLNADRLRGLMQTSRFGLGNLAAALFGALTPFCSCSSIPIFIGFVNSRVPLGIAFSFLVTSPLVNEVAFVIMGGLFGWHLALLYAASGILLGVFAGILLGQMGLEKNLILNEAGRDLDQIHMPRSFRGRMQFAFVQAKRTLRKLFPYVLGGVAIGAIIHGYVPEEFFMRYIASYSVLSVPIAVLMGMPIYAGCSAVVPLIFSITANGVPLGTSLAFMMSIAGLSLPEAIILKRVMNVRLLATFFAVVGVGIVMIGYLFNVVG